jgi:hypothetical protein
VVGYAVNSGVLYPAFSRVGSVFALKIPIFSMNRRETVVFGARQHAI